MATNKMTTVKALEVALSYVPADMTDVVEKLEKMKEQAIKKNTAPRKPSAKQVENDAVRAEILDFLRTVGQPVTIADIKAGVPTLADATSQRVSGLLRVLYMGAMVTKFVDKRVTYFEIVEGV